jgi:hypothetical protein
MLACMCVHSKAWLARARYYGELACLALLGVRRSRRLRATLMAAPVLFAHSFGPFHVEKTYRNGGTDPCPMQA